MGSKRKYGWATARQESTARYEVTVRRVSVSQRVDDVIHAEPVRIVRGVDREQP